jgi:hypothetical protein
MTEKSQNVSQNLTGVNVQTANTAQEIDAIGELTIVENIPELETLSDPVDDLLTSSTPAPDIEKATQEVVEAVKALATAEKETVKAAADEVNAVNEAIKADAIAKRAKLVQKRAEEEKVKAEAVQKKAEEERKNVEAARKAAEAEKIKAEAAKAEAEEVKAKAEAAKKMADEVRAKAEAAKKMADEVRAKAEAKREALVQQIDPMAVTVTTEFQGVCVGWVKSSNADDDMVMAACAKTGKNNTCPAVFNSDTCTILQPLNAKVGRGVKMTKF